MHRRLADFDKQVPADHADKCKCHGNDFPDHWRISPCSFATSVMNNLLCPNHWKLSSVGAAKGTWSNDTRADQRIWRLKTCKGRIDLWSKPCENHPHETEQIFPRSAGRSVQNRTRSHHRHEPSTRPSWRRSGLGTA